MTQEFKFSDLVSLEKSIKSVPLSPSDIEGLKQVEELLVSDEFEKVLNDLDIEPFEFKVIDDELQIRTKKE